MGMSVYQLVYLRNDTFIVQILCMLFVTTAHVCCDGIAVCYVHPVLHAFTEWALVSCIPKWRERNSQNLLHQFQAFNHILLNDKISKYTSWTWVARWE